MEIQFKNISKKYGEQFALNSINTTLTAGVYGLLGPNGSGKTTLINIMVGILEADNGTVFFNGEDVKKMGTRYLDNIGYLPQDPMFYRNFRSEEFLEYMCVLKNIPKNQISERIKEVLEFVNLTDAYKKKVGSLSGGMRQRLGVAQAILNRPKILILDEPTAGLDPVERIRLRNLISKLSKDKLVLVATHIVPDVEYIAKEIIVLKKGKLITQGTPKKLIDSISTKVWNITLDESQVESYMEQFLVGNIKQVGDKYHLKVISEDKPVGTANSVVPTLEDVFYSIFGNMR